MDENVKRPATLAEVRAWAIRQGIPVGARGHVPQSLIQEFNRRHHKRIAQSANPWAGPHPRKEVVQ